jgi:hypothetical protein
MLLLTGLSNKLNVYAKSKMILNLIKKIIIQVCVFSAVN